MKQKLQTLFLLLIFLSVSMTLKAQRISGTVISAAGEPIPGVNIAVKGSLVGTTTDIDGKFNITASPENTLVFSAVGYQFQEVLVGNQTQLSVTLAESDEQLDEIVVTALGIKKEARS
ncbi:MAG: SusC/RagA family TonB-linked outer membrane protein, partial [Bacteroidia bacterium]|nr:SusC/RagA family TonB-linked outer membrane protein [Bacteroidia bacterium]